MFYQNNYRPGAPKSPLQLQHDAAGLWEVNYVQMCCEYCEFSITFPHKMHFIQ